MQTRLDYALSARERDARAALLDGLDAAQARVVEHPGGPLLVRAGAGSGKTKTVVNHIAYTILVRRVPAARIFAVTFTSAGADEMNERLEALLGADHGARVQTFHSFCRAVLKRDFPGFGAWKPDEVALADARYTNLLRTACQRAPRNAGPDEARDYVNWYDVNPETLDAFVELAKARMIEPGTQASLDLAATFFRHGSLVERLDRVYEIAERKRRHARYMTFADWLVETARLLATPAIARAWQKRFDYVWQDEAQDQSPVQTTIVEILAQAHRNYVMVGDPNQSIYAFRGAAPELVTTFPERWQAPAIDLARNYRSSDAVVGAGNRVAARLAADGGVGVVMVPTRGLPGRVAVTAHPNTEAEGEAVAQTIVEYARDGAKWRDHMVLYRSHAAARAVEEALARAGVPYRVCGAAPFFEQPDAVALLAYLRLAVKRARIDDLVTSLRMPFRMLPRRFFDALGDAVRSAPRGSSLRDITKVAIEEAKLGSFQERDVKAWVALVVELRAKVFAGASPQALLALAVERTRYTDWLAREETGDRGEDRLAIVSEVQRAAALFDDAGAFIDHAVESAAAARRDEYNRDADRVELMTVHRCVHPDTWVETANGLERIREIAATGTIATPTGPQRYLGKVELPSALAYVIRTRCGYELTVTPEHGMSTWDGATWRRVEARELRTGQLLRLRLGATCDRDTLAPLPPCPPGDVRAFACTTPAVLTEDVAELLGMIVADGTVCRSRLRLIKRYQTVLDRFAALGRQTFGLEPHAIDHLGTGGVEFNSTRISAWLRESLDGMCPNNKHVPSAVLRSPLRVQAAFLRGLFEDGTVNETDGKVDHIHWENVTPSVVADVQVMLLRLGIISSRRTHDRITSLYIYGRSAQVFARRVGFVAPEKNNRLLGHIGEHSNFTAPLSRDEQNALWPHMAKHDRNNVRTRGYLSRQKIAELIARSATTEASLLDKLAWHYDPIVSIEPTTCPSVCVSVPEGTRFLQNGFDGWNSKGLERKHVFVVNLVQGVFPSGRANGPEERRLFYVAVTRARDNLHLSWSESGRIPKTGEKVRQQPSELLALVCDEPMYSDVDESDAPATGLGLEKDEAFSW